MQLYLKGAISSLPVEILSKIQRSKFIKCSRIFYTSIWNGNTKKTCDWNFNIFFSSFFFSRVCFYFFFVVTRTDWGNRRVSYTWSFSSLCRPSPPTDPPIAQHTHSVPPMVFLRSFVHSSIRPSPARAHVVEIILIKKKEWKEREKMKHTHTPCIG